MCRCHLGERSSQWSPAMKTTRNLPGRCMPPLKCPRHATVWRVNNYHIPLPAHLSIRKHYFLPPKNMSLGSQDIHFAQVQHARALQHWAKEVHPQPTSLPGKEGAGAPVSYGAPHHFHRRRHLHGHSAIPMDGNNHTMVNKGCPPGVTKKLCMKQQGPPKGIPICNLQWRLACYHHSVGYCKERSTYNMPWESMLLQSTSDHKPPCPPPVCKDCKALWGEEPVKSGPPSVIVGTQSEVIIDQYEVRGQPWWQPGCFDIPPQGKYLSTYSFVLRGLWAWGLTPQWMTTWLWPFRSSLTQMIRLSTSLLSIHLPISYGG